MIDEDQLAYLDASFDAGKLTKPQLRSILGKHGVTELPPANAKKDVLLAIFEEKVRGKAEEIRRSLDQVKPSSKGITFLDNQSQPSPKMTPTRIRAETDRSPSKSPTRSSAKKQLPEIATEQKPKSRGRSKTTAVEEVKRSKSKARSKSVVRKVSPELTYAHLDTPIKALSEALPARVDSPATATVKLQRRLGYIATANNMPLAQNAISPVYADSPSRRAGLSPRSSNRFFGKIARFIFYIFKFAMALSLTFSLAIYLRWKYIYPIPYCESGAPVQPFYPEVDALTSIRNLCLSCPAHGKCSSGRLSCDDGYVKTAKWISFGDVCVPDWKRFSKAEALVKTIKQVLRERQGAFQCKQCISPTLSEDQLKGILTSDRFKRSSWATSDFESYYRLALLDLSKDPENHGIKVLGRQDEKIFLSNLAIFSLRCQIYLLLQAYFWYLMATAGLVICLFILYIKIKSAQRESKKVEELVQTVLQCLAEQDALNRRDRTRPSTISVPQLRDALFMNASGAEKTRLWPRVVTAISSNSNVRESVMSIKGEQHRVWEWIGMDVLAPFSRLSTDE